MTQKNRWLTALALLLAVNVFAARAEEEESVKPPAPRPAAEVLPPPKCVDGAGSCIRIEPPAVPAMTWPVQFVTPYPGPVAPAGLTPYSQPCAACPCPVGSACCANCPLCCTTAARPNEYMVQLTLCRATADGGREVVTQPQVRVPENQAGVVDVSCGAASSEPCSVRMQMTLEKQGDGALLALAVEDAHCIRNDEQAMVRTRTETMETRCHVALGAPTKLVLGENADGSPRTWVEVTVKEGKSDAHTAATCPAARPCDDDAAPMTALAQCVNDIMCSIVDSAAAVFGGETWSDPPALPAPQYLQHPPQYFPAEPASPMARETTGCGTSCPAACGAYSACTRPADAACTQCAATTAAQPAMHFTIDGSGDRKCVEITTGKRRLKASADRLTMHDHCITLEGNVQAESCDDSCCAVIKAAKMCVEHKDGGLTIQVDDCTAIHTDK